MNRLRAWIRSFFSFSRSETRAFMIMLPLMVLLLLSQPLYRQWLIRSSRSSIQPGVLDSLVATWRWEATADSITPPARHLEPFDPNRNTIKELVDLGLPAKLAQRIANYRAKGGKFKIKNDLQKIYGMDSALFSALYEFISLPEKVIRPKGAQTAQPERKASMTRFDLNLADSIQLVAIYGIGPWRSRTILRYRQRLGGFVSIEQLSEVYGLDSIAVGQVKKRAFIRNDYQPRQIPINRATEGQLGSHPYVKFNLAKSITAYRFQHGAFRTLEDLKQLALLDEVTFEKIKPYLTLKDSL